MKDIITSSALMAVFILAQREISAPDSWPALFAVVISGALLYSGILCTKNRMIKEDIQEILKKSGMIKS
jgi:hypothetical protein